MPESFKTHLSSLGIAWEKAPEFAAIEGIPARIIIGQNGCGKSRLLRALRTTLQENGVKDTEIIYADFPEMAAVEGAGMEQTARLTLERFFIDQRNNPIVDTFINISREPAQAISKLMRLSEGEEAFSQLCKAAVEKINELLKSMSGSLPDISTAADLLGREAWLSPGQRSMLYMMVALGVLSAHHSGDQFYVLLDEPELHLHPKTISSFIKSLREHLPMARLWVATHSVHLIASFTFDQIIYIEDGVVQRNDSSVYDRVVESMIATEEVQDFALHPGLYGFYRFFSECFEDPDSESEPSDKLSSIKERIRGYGITSVLDYGAAKGRFFKLLQDIDGLNYHAYEIDDRYHENLKNLMSDPHNLYTTADDIPNDAYDAVLLVNTLHEIPLSEWATTLEHIKRTLKKDGRLFFCETVPLLTGENIKDTGYLVLGSAEQQVLFGVEPEFLDEGQKLHFCDVPRSKIPRFSQRMMKSVLTTLRESSYKSWLGERKNARKAAYYAIQHMNADTALGKLRVSKQPSAEESLSKDSESSDTTGVVGKLTYDLRTINRLETIMDYPIKLGGIDWLIIGTFYDAVCLISKYTTASMLYTNTYVSYSDTKWIRWESSRVKRYLDDEFALSFSWAEQARLQWITDDRSSETPVIITILDRELYEKIGDVSIGKNPYTNRYETWWLKSNALEGKGEEALYVDPKGVVQKGDPRIERGVRPLVVYKPPIV